ncbi:MAG TPA: hypothetical protein VL359_18910 [bacterium]|nr:hypothetical protein [bacterium]
MAEYGLMTQIIEVTPELADASASEMGQALTMKLNPLVQAASRGLGSLEGGGWSMVSHSLTRVDRHLVLTILIKR